jgi:hypothetical protein
MMHEYDNDNGTLIRLGNETVAFWRKYARRNRLGVSKELLGTQIIRQDPEYWSQASMSRLWDEVNDRLR